VLVSQKPPANSLLAANKAYTFTWVIQNTGTIKWDQNEYDVNFVSSSSGSSTRAGSSVYNLPTTVMPGATLTLSVPFTTPGKAGSYTETWAIAQTKKVVCSFDITIQVK
jgi:Flp pilus assembly protein TadG